MYVALLHLRSKEPKSMVSLLLHERPSAAEIRYYIITRIPYKSVGYNLICLSSTKLVHMYQLARCVTKVVCMYKLNCYYMQL